MQTIRNDSGFKMTEVWRRRFLLVGLAVGVLIGLNRPTRAMTFQSDMDALVKQAGFIFHSWIIGNNLGIIEVGRMEAPASSDTLRQQNAEAKQRPADQKLQQRLAQAAMVIVGKVTGIKQGPQPDIFSEHNPDLWEAKLQIKSVELGPSTQRTVTILYANSIDVVWVRSPKFKKGQEGIWILHRDQAVDWKRGSRLPVESLTALDSEDFLPLNQLERVQRLLKKIR
jgi:hypothetical protein